MLDFWPLGRFCHIHESRNEVTGQQTNERLNIFRLLWEKVPFFALAVVSSIVTLIVQERGGAMKLLNPYSLQTRIINAFVAYIEYIVNMIWPVELAVLYPHPGNSLPLWKGVVAGLALVLITILVIRKAREIPYLAVGWLWYVITLIPVIGIVQVGSQAMADRYTYITLIGLFVIIAWGANDLLSKWPHRRISFGTLAVILLPILIVLTWKQVQYWENSITLFKHTLKHTSNNNIIQNNLGVAYNDSGKYKEAIEVCKKSIRIKPDYAKAHFNLGVAYGESGMYKEAIEACKKAISLDPDYATAHTNLGVAYGVLGMYKEAIDVYRQAIEIEPDSAKAHFGLGYACVLSNDRDSATEQYKILKSLDPERANRLFELINK